MKSAQALGLPTWMLLFSWDNLSTKGALHVAPDLMFVWNERQRREAAELHDFPADRVVVAGAPRFDSFFALDSRVARSDFFRPLGLDPARPTLLYLCSSRFIAEDEPAFIRTWLQAPAPRRRAARGLQRDRQAPSRRAVRRRRRAGGGAVGGDAPGDRLGPSPLRRRPGPRAAHHLPHTGGVLRVPAPCRAVVALNTSAELEAGIAGRPVFTVLANDQAGRRPGANAALQLPAARARRLRQLRGGPGAARPRSCEAAVAEPPPAGTIEGFVRDFLRPHGDAAGGAAAGAPAGRTCGGHGRRRDRRPTTPTRVAAPVDRILEPLPALEPAAGRPDTRPAPRA